MIKQHLLFFAFLLVFAVVIVMPLSAAENTARTGDGVQTSGASLDKSNRAVMTDMVVPPECLDYGRTVCAQLPANSTRQLLYGTLCYKLRNKTANALFVPLRSDFEIEQFLLNAPADQVHREPCNAN